MDDVTRLFRKLVGVLADADPAQLREPFRVADLYERILPYRRFKRDLKFDSVEDYDMAVLRLLAGDGGYAAVEPIEAREAIALEADAVRPDTDAFRAFGNATVRLQERAVQSVLTEEWAFAPPVFPLPDAPARGHEREHEQRRREGERGSRGLVFEAVPEQQGSPGKTEVGDATASPRAAGAPRCAECDAPLPERRSVAFCPFCGHGLERVVCPSCGEPMESGWRFCGTCGHAADG